MDDRSAAGGGARPTLIDRYRERLPLPRGAAAVSLGEGGTPLIRLARLAKRIGFKGELHAKYEGLNPTGSFKDRGMTVAVTHAAHQGARAVICASTGNTSASAAAYAAHAGLRAVVLIPEGKIALGKLAQAVMHGARVIQVRGNFDDGMRLVKELARELPVTVVNSINPYRLHGQKTAVFEIIEALGRVPDVHCLPVGNAGNISACWIGYSECAAMKTAAQAPVPETYSPLKCAERRPVMAGYQAAGAAPFVSGGPVAQPETVATAIRIGNPQSWDLAQAARKESGGWFAACTDAEILAAQKLLAAEEGVFCEPASAASVAGAMKDIADGRIAARATVVCTLTGHGLKDPDIAMRDGLKDLKQVPAERTAVERLLREDLS